MQILAVIFPPVLFLNSPYLLLGLVASVILAWGMLWLRNNTWKDVGFRKPDHMGRLVLITLIATAILFPLSTFAIQAIKAFTGQTPNLEAFEAIRGNLHALVAGLVVAWIFGAFLEEFLFRGFLLNTFHELLSKEGNPKWVAWTGAVVGTSVLVGVGHLYQGIVGMMGTGLIAVGFSVIYLINQRNLWSCILAHGLYNTVAFVLVYNGMVLYP